MRAMDCMTKGYDADRADQLKRIQEVKDATAKARPVEELRAEHAKRVEARQAQRYA